MQVLKKNPSFFPLWGWALVIGVVLLVLFLSHQLTKTNAFLSYEADLSFNLQRLDDSANAHAIVALGSSLSRLAYKYDEEMEKRLDAINIDNNFIRISADNAERSSYENILEKVANNKPSLVLIELEMIFIYRGKEWDQERHDRSGGFNTNLLRSTKFLKDSLLKLLGAKNSLLTENYSPTDFCKNKARLDKNEFQKITNPKQQKFTRYPTQLSEKWLRFFKTVKDNGGQIAFVKMGRSDYATQLLTPNFIAEYTQAGSIMQAQYGIETWEYPGPFTPDYYCDLAHLNAKGHENFTLWFTNKLESRKHD